MRHTIQNNHPCIIVVHGIFSIAFFIANEQWCFGIQLYWTTTLVEYNFIGMQLHWNTALLECNIIGKQISQRSIKGFSFSQCVYYLTCISQGDKVEDDYFTVNIFVFMIFTCYRSGWNINETIWDNFVKTGFNFEVVLSTCQDWKISKCPVYVGLKWVARNNSGFNHNYWQF